MLGRETETDHLMVKRLATKYRSAIEKAVDEKEESWPSLNSFPKGSCGTASEMLAEYLREHGIETYYVYGTYQDGDDFSKQSHAWLETSDEITIDITRDQFRGQKQFLNWEDPVYVGPQDAFQRLFEDTWRFSLPYLHEGQWDGWQIRAYKIIHDKL